MRKILLISNSKPFLERNKCLLEKSGFRLFTSTSAMEALQIQREIMADLIITMLDLPEVGGDLLCSMIRRDKELLEVPIIVVCYNSPESLQRAAICGANAWVVKPVQPQLLLEEVGKLLTYQRPREQRVVLKTMVTGTVRSLRFSGFTHNISVSGLLFETPVPLVQQDLIQDFAIGINAGQIVVAGKIVRSVEMPGGTCHYGVQFANLACTCLQEICRFIAVNNNLFDDPQLADGGDGCPSP